MEIKENTALEIQILPSLEYLRLVRNFVKQIIEIQSPEFMSRLHELQVCISEAMANSICAHQEIENPDPITVRFAFSADHIMVEVIDRGKGFDLKACKPAKADAYNEKGRGLNLIMNMADVCEIKPSSSGTRIQISMYLKKPQNLKAAQ